MSRSEEQRSVDVMDIYRMNMVSDPQVSPCGKEVAFVLTEVLREDNEYSSHICIVDVESHNVQRFTTGKMDESPRWSPDGSRIAFISERSGSRQLWVIPVGGGEARQVTDLSGPVMDPQWSPDGSRIAFVHEVDLSEEAEGDDCHGGYESNVRSYTRLWYKYNGEGFWDGKWKQIYCVDVEEAEPERLTDGEFDHSDPAWSPDGRKIAFTADRRAGADLDSKCDIYSVELTSKDIQQITDTWGPASAPSYSPDGQCIAFNGHNDTYASATSSKVWLVPADGSEEPEALSRELDRSMPGGLGSDIGRGVPKYRPIWSHDRESVLSIAVDKGAVNLYRISVEVGEVQAVTQGMRNLRFLSSSADGSVLAFVASDPTHPGDVHIFDVISGEEKQLTHVNSSVLCELEFSEPERFFCQNDEWEIDGWLMKPTDCEEGESYPLILKIHGGPHGAYGYSFQHHFQLLAAQGYAVLFTNPRGSRGYGQDFCKATHHDWGGGDFADIMAAVDYASSLPFVDESRMGVTGASFGGYMTNWIIAHSDRFDAAVTEVTTSNRYSQWGTSDYGHSNGKWEFPGFPWSNWESAKHYLERSPISYVEDMNTPLLIVQAENDHRCPLEQAEQLYTALVVLQRKVELVIVPDESHGFSRIGQPRHREERLVRISDWFREHLVGEV